MASSASAAASGLPSAALPAAAGATSAAGARPLEGLRIACIGSGYVGGPTMAMIAAKCPMVTVTVLDLWKERIDAWNSDALPIYEPGLKELVMATRGRNLFFTTEIDANIEAADIIFVAVNTPTKTSGVGAGRAADVKNIELAGRSIARVATTPKVVVEKSTVPLKTGEALRRVLDANGRGLAHTVLSNPEFLAEGTAVRDLERPSRVLIGGDAAAGGGLSAATALLVNLYAEWVRGRCVGALRCVRTAALGRWMATRGASPRSPLVLAGATHLLYNCRCPARRSSRPTCGPRSSPSSWPTLSWLSVSAPSTGACVCGRRALSRSYYLRFQSAVDFTISAAAAPRAPAACALSLKLPLFPQRRAPFVAPSATTIRPPSFSRSISALCEATSADVDEVARAVGSDTRIGPHFLKASVGFGGSCFKKDVLNLAYLCETQGLAKVADYWTSVIELNDWQQERFAAKVGTIARVLRIRTCAVSACIVVQVLSFLPPHLPRPRLSVCVRSPPPSPPVRSSPPCSTRSLTSASPSSASPSRRTRATCASRRRRT